MSLYIVCRIRELCAKGASKEQAVKNLCAHCNITMDEVMVFGDDWNDYGLFRACGFSVAMGNAIQELKDIADFVTDTNDEDGVAKVLEE